MATQKMLKFVSTPREMPEKRSATERSEDFHEIYREFADAKAAEQASRRRAGAENGPRRIMGYLVKASGHTSPSVAARQS